MATVENNHHVFESTSNWMEQEPETVNPLSENLDVDVCVVGGGIAGLTTAYFLARAHVNVCVLEDSAIGKGQTGRSTAQLSTLLDRRYRELEKIHGTGLIQKIAQAQMEAISLMEEITRTENINCDLSYVNGYLYADPAVENSAETVREEFSATQRAGLLNVEYMSRGPLSFMGGPTLKFPNQIQFHPVKYLRGLVKAIESYGGKVFTGTHVSEMKENEDRQEIQTIHGFRVRASSLVVATNSPINNRVAIHGKQAAYRTYVVSFAIPRGLIPEGFYWDTNNPYHYARLSHDGAADTLMVGGEDHRTGQNNHTEEAYDRIIQWAKDRFPQLGPVTHKWSGQVIESIDGLPYMGRNPYDSKNVYILTGDSGDGTSFYTIGGKLVSDLLLHGTSYWEELYSPSRMRMRAIPSMVMTTVNEISQYAKWLTPEEIHNIEAIPSGEGALMGNGVTKLAVYRDGAGRLFWISAKCTHMGGVVNWNTAEKSWDCPCHGARFDPYGHVIEGPALEDLESIHSYGSPSYRPELTREKPPLFSSPVSFEQ